MASAAPLAGKRAIVTGAASGLGRATAIMAADQGASVVVADINEQGAHDVAKLIGDAGGVALSCYVDIGDADSVRAMIDLPAQCWGGLDILDNNAALTSLEHAALDTTITDIPVDVWNRTLAVTLTGTMLCCRAAIPVMLAGGGGSIVNISSIAGQRGDLGIVSYSAVKAGIISLTQHVATVYGKDGIRCNAVAPGLTVTPATRTTMPEELFGIFRRHILTPDVGEPDDVAAAVCFLASDAARYITGHVLNVDGGLTAHQPTVADMRAAASGYGTGSA